MPARARLRATTAIAALLLSAGALATTLVSPAAQSRAWSAEIVDLGQPVSTLRQIGDEVYVEAGRWYRAMPCDEVLCLSPSRPPVHKSARDGIPGGAIATADGPGIVEAWYGNPTTRYDHGILGDRIEGGSLIVVDDSGLCNTITLDPGHVFEDITLRIADIDGHGRNDVVVIRSGLATGAAIAIYSVPGSALVERASIPPIGLTHRWLNVAGIADFNGDGALDIAIVKTPHIGGRLDIWTMRGGRLMLLAAAKGFSNHVIGSTELGLAAVADANRDGLADLALPADDRSTLRIVGLRGSSIVDIASVPLGAPIVAAIGKMVTEGRPVFIVGLQDGALVLVRPNR